MTSNAVERNLVRKWPMTASRCIHVLICDPDRVHLGFALRQRCSLGAAHPSCPSTTCAIGNSSRALGRSSSAYTVTQLPLKPVYDRLARLPLHVCPWTTSAFRLRLVELGCVGRQGRHRAVTVSVLWENERKSLLLRNAVKDGTLRQLGYVVVDDEGRKASRPSRCHVSSRKQCIRLARAQPQVAALSVTLLYNEKRVENT